MDIDKLLKSVFAKKTPPPKIYKPGWDAERAEAARQWCLANKPWLKSTGPRTAEGKAISSQNAFRHGGRSRVMTDILHIISELKKPNRV